MDRFQDYLTAQSAQIPMLAFVVNLLLAAVLAFVLSKVYVRYGSALSNRKKFSRSFMMLSLTTVIIITVVKSSLALSLGLVGALSIVRFRAAIKEPEELMYLFLVIAIGLGFGANQTLVTIIGFLLAIVVICVVSTAKGVEDDQNLFLNIVGHNPHEVEVDAIIPILTKYCTSVKLRRLDESEERLEVSFLVEFAGFEKLNQAKEELLKLSRSIRIVFLDNKGVS
ncbi:MAG: DUF4956 domain-containing protein [Parcubacteria group bacterium]|jgi:hypothetical protein|nr:DUF4956 domain-containing protein [Parcubacteria group bacterium]|tara:strand:- start:4865 stop:5539 length:675 start_codon:yes stop_codon:yes gene_type:complete